MLRNTYSVLSTIQAAAADITQSQGVLSITGLVPMKYSLIQGTGAGELAPVAETLGVQTVTPTAANNSTYTLVITQYVKSIGRLVTEQISYTTAASGDTATTICNAWRAQLAAFKDLKITGSSAATLVLTAQTGNAIFTVIALQSSIAVVNGTPGVASRGTYADLVSAGVDASLLSVGATYSTTVFDYGVLSSNTVGGQTSSEENIQTLYTDIAATNYAAFSTRLDEVLNDYAAGTTDADPANLAIIE